MRTRNRGFTLVELLVVVAILSLLAVAVVVAINPAARIQAAIMSTARANVKSAANAIERCLTDYLTTDPTATEATAISNCYTATQLRLTVPSTDVVAKTLTNTSVCYSSPSSVSGQFVKYTHSSGGATAYTEVAIDDCLDGT